MMRLGILICDQVQSILQTEFGDYPAMFSALLKQVDDTLELRFYSAIGRELPTDINDCDAYMTTGSRWGANDDKLWIRELEDFIRLLYNAEKRFVGICFGHQLIAKSLGGRVDKSDKGWGIGVAFSQVVAAQDWMLPMQTKLDLVVSHQDQITELPPQAQVLASNDFCPYSMIQVGSHFLGIQGHPEFSRQYSQALMNTRKDRISAPVICAGSQSLKHEVDDLLAMKWIINFLKQT
jgi:GMP synthase (glutamine-hydrolysing)